MLRRVQEARDPPPAKSSSLPARPLGPVHESHEIVRAHLVGIDRLLSRTTAPHLTQLEPGVLRTRMFRFLTPGFELSGGRTSLAIRSAGTTLSRCTTVTFVLDAPGPTFMNGRPTPAGSVLVWRPGASYDGIAPAGYRWVTLLASGEQLPSLPGGSPGRRPWPWATSLLGARLEPAEQRATSALLAEMRAWTAPGRAPLAPAVARHLREAWLSIADRAVGRAAALARPTWGVWRATLNVRAADRIFRKDIDQPKYVGSVSRAIGVSNRTLEASFRSILGMSPMAYLEALRLHALFVLLRSTSVDSPRTVSEAARSCGLLHPSRLASRYRAVFGEDPRQTLADALRPTQEPRGDGPPLRSSRRVTARSPEPARSAPPRRGRARSRSR
jgi:AraC-like DNA-binding protein